MGIQEIKPKVYIDFNIIKNSNDAALMEELQYLIGLNQFVVVWSKLTSIEDMMAYSVEHNLTDHIWDYKMKDSFYYESVDFVIDDSQKFVDMFIRNGKKGNCIERIV
jgi:hypothetical protein